jgi:hypothetical protein
LLLSTFLFNSVQISILLALSCSTFLSFPKFFSSLFFFSLFLCSPYFTLLSIPTVPTVLTSSTLTIIESYFSRLEKVEDRTLGVEDKINIQK